MQWVGWKPEEDLPGNRNSTSPNGRTNSTGKHSEIGPYNV